MHVTSFSLLAIKSVGLGERTVGRFGLERTIEARNWFAEYDRAVALDALGLGRLQASVVSVLTTPQASVLGKTFNPVGEYSTGELVALVQNRSDELEAVERVGERLSVRPTVRGDGA